MHGQGLTVDTPLYAAVCVECVFYAVCRAAAQLDGFPMHNEATLEEFCVLARTYVGRKRTGGTGGA